jgi:hypothetical protein
VVEAAAVDDVDERGVQGERHGQANHKDWARLLPTSDSEAISGCAVGSGCEWREAGGRKKERRWARIGRFAIVSPK